MNNTQETKEININGVIFKLYTFNRSLDLCSRMNYETENLDFINTLPKGSVMYDLGACEGRFSIYAILKDINVFSFEPDKKNYKVLLENLKINNLFSDNHFFNLGVGEKNSTALLQIGQPWPGGHQKVVKHDEVRSDLNFNFVETETIQLISLDSFVFDKKMAFPYALKIDIDGSEMPFLKGALKTLKDHRLKKIIFELDTNDNNFIAIEKILSDSGLKKIKSYQVPNEPTLFNIVYERINK